MSMAAVHASVPGPGRDTRGEHREVTELVENPCLRSTFLPAATDLEAWTPDQITVKATLWGSITGSGLAELLDLAWATGRVGIIAE
jgi:hypothetical protein